MSACKMSFLRSLVCLVLSVQAIALAQRGRGLTRTDVQPGVPCAQGFVWREAFAGDDVCVTSQSRSVVARENTDPAHAEPCQPGTVWREARPSDHVCVSLARRGAVADENNRASTRVAGAPEADDRPPAPCAQGWVWREAFAGDYVCVSSASRSVVAKENTDPAHAEPCQPGTVWREARPSDHICVSLARRGAVADENRQASTRVVGAVLPVPPPSRTPAPPAGPTGGQTGDLSNDTAYWNQYGFSVSVDRSASLSDLIFEWKCRSERYDSFNVRVRISNGKEGQVEVPGGDHGSYRERNAIAGTTYIFMVQGCHSGTFSSACTPWSQQVFANVGR
jgi:hypothetical protein